MVDLILKDITDPYVRENFFRLSNFLKSQVWFQGDFKFFDVTIPDKAEAFPIKHGLTFIPADIVTLAVSGDYNFYFLYGKFTPEYIYVKTNGAVRLRFLAGKLSSQIKNELNATLPSVGLGAISSPGFTYSAVATKNGPFWLSTDGIPSNKVGIPVLFNNAVIEQAAVGTESPSTYTIEIWQHEGNEVNKINLGQFTITPTSSSRVPLNLPVTYGSTNIQLACRLLSGTTTNLKVSLVVKGNDL